MGLHFDTDVYKANYELIMAIIKVIKPMPREYKAIVGGEMRDLALRNSLLILRANKAQDKRPHLDAIIENKETIELLTRLARDLILISPRQYGEIVALTASVGRQVNGWRNQQSRQTHEGQGHHDRALF